jgi:PhoPQ-activated pathogenicity-related protein
MGRFRSLLPTGRHTVLTSTVLAATLLIAACGGEPAHAPEPAASAQPHSAPARATEQTALDRYVAAPDPHFAWKAVRTIPAKGVTATVLEMTSQQWLTTAEVQQPIWTHWLIVARPERVTSDIGLLYIGGGANDGKPPAVSGWLADVARDTGTVVAELRMVPNQPVVFTDDPQRKPRYEDDFIAYTWDTFLRTGDDRWPARLPMTKAAVRAMDAITAFAATPDGGAARVERFVVSGGSKRGWTTWTTAAVDRRVIAIAPAVIDLLNIEPSFVHHWRAYGFWAPAIQDYVDHGIMDWRGTPEFAALMRIVEPYEYRARLTMPTFILNAAGDEFFLPDSSQFYFDDLPGERHLRYVPNTGHGLDDSDAIQSLHAFYSSDRDQQAAAIGAVAVRRRWHGEGHGLGGTATGATLAGHEPVGPRLPHRRAREAVPRDRPPALEPQYVGGARRAACERMDGLLRGADVPERRPPPVHVHHGRARDPGHAAASAAAHHALTRMQDAGCRMSERGIQHRHSTFNIQHSTFPFCIVHCAFCISFERYP